VRVELNNQVSHWVYDSLVHLVINGSRGLFQWDCGVTQSVSIVQSVSVVSKILRTY
jgi:hypothetical protein